MSKNKGMNKMKFKQWCGTCNKQVDIEMDEDNITIAECPICGRPLKPCPICNGQCCEEDESCTESCPFRLYYLCRLDEFLKNN